MAPPRARYSTQRYAADIVGAPTALDRRLRELKPLVDPVILKT
ncbi:hypothetical protein [Bradyrhizobium sp. RT6a]|jgi:hypothetical protein